MPPSAANFDRLPLPAGFVKAFFQVFLSFLKTPYAASQGCLSVDYIDVVNSNAESGDASLISYNNKYVLIDGGKSSAYIDKLKKFLVSVCNPTNGKIVLEAVIVSHNHSDHYGGIVKLLKDTNTFKVKKVIKSNVAPVTALMLAKMLRALKILLLIVENIR